MNVIGIVAEYNPFHNGHLYQIKKVREIYKDAIIIVALSGNFTERGTFSILDKWDKTRLALQYGVDVVLEIPFVFCNQSADSFSYAAIKLLSEFGIDTLVFGSESNNLELLTNTARVQINNPSFDNLLRKFIKEGNNYPTSLSKAIYELTNEKVSESNDLLAVSYIKEILKNNLNITVLPIKRTNTYLDTESDEDIVSADNIRKKLLLGKDISRHVPSLTKEFIRFLDYDKFFMLLKYKIISDKDEIKRYHLVDEGIHNRIYEAALISNNIYELISNIKTKRYTFNKINRILINIFTGFTKEMANKFKTLEYIRILGFSVNGQKYYKNIKKKVSIPVINKFQKYDMLQLELKVTILYSFIVNDFSLRDKEVRNFAIKET